MYFGITDMCEIVLECLMILNAKFFFFFFFKLSHCSLLIRQVKIITKENKNKGNKKKIAVGTDLSIFYKHVKVLLLLLLLL